MEASQAKRQTGIKKLWAKLKTLFKSKPPPPATMVKSSAAISSKPSQAGDQNKVDVPLSTNLNPQSKNIESEQLQSTPASAQPTQQPTNTHLRLHEDGEKLPAGVIEVDNDDLIDQDPCRLPDPSRPRSLSSGADLVAQRTEIVKDIYSRYGLKIEAAEFKLKTKTQIERVERKPRMRVRWTCHECRSTFGKDKSCPKCTHWRCPDCSRYPPKKAGGKVRRMPAKNTPVSDIIQRPTTGACHECKSTFDFPAAQCENCHHQICERCIKESIEELPLPAQPITNR